MTCCLLASRACSAEAAPSAEQPAKQPKQPKGGKKGGQQESTSSDEDIRKLRIQKAEVWRGGGCLSVSFRVPPCYLRMTACMCKLRRNRWEAAWSSNCAHRAQCWGGICRRTAVPAELLMLCFHLPCCRSCVPPAGSRTRTTSPAPTRPRSCSRCTPTWATARWRRGRRWRWRGASCLGGSWASLPFSSWWTHPALFRCARCKQAQPEASVWRPTS